MTTSRNKLGLHQSQAEFKANHGHGCPKCGSKNFLREDWQLAANRTTLVFHHECNKCHFHWVANYHWLGPQAFPTDTHCPDCEVLDAHPITIDWRTGNPAVHATCMPCANNWKQGDVEVLGYYVPEAP